MKLSYSKVFDRYTKSFTDKLAELSFSLYKTSRLRLAKIIPLSEREEHQLSNHFLLREESASMPQGFDYTKKEYVDGFVKLDYIDFYDHLPKEDLPKFVKELKKCMRRNKATPFGMLHSRKKCSCTVRKQATENKR